MTMLHRLENRWMEFLRTTALNNWMGTTLALVLHHESNHVARHWSSGDRVCVLPPALIPR